MFRPYSRRLTSIAAPLLAVMVGFVATGPASPRTASADWSIETRTTLESPTGGSLQRAGRLVFDATHLRMEFASGPTLDTVRLAIVLFDAGAGTVRAIDVASRNYVQLDQAEIDALAGRIAQTREEMERVLPVLPPDEQQAVRQMILDMSPAPAAAAPQETLVVGTETRQIDGQTATLIDLMIGERLVGEVWVAPMQPFGLVPADLAVFEAFSRFQADLIERLGVAAAQSFGDAPLALFERVDGVPLLVRRIAGGRVESETHFGPIRRVDADPDRFRVPDDYRRAGGPDSGPSAPPLPSPGAPASSTE